MCAKSTNMEKTIHSGDLVVGLTVSQLKALIGEIILDLSPNKTEEPEYLTAPEAAAFLGYKVATLYDMVHRRVLPFVKPENNGRRLYFERAKLLAWKTARQFETHEEAFQKHIAGKAARARKDVMDIETETEFLRRNLREAKTFLKLLQFIHALLLNQKSKS